jgi:heme oxygenase (biliverdin-IX-beta and delta-forming)
LACADALCTRVAKKPDVDEVSSTLVRLNLETRGYHAAADAGWRALLTPDVSRSRYRDHLVAVYGFEGPLEAAFAYTSNLGLVIDVHERFRAGYVAQDLLALGLKPVELAKLPQCVLAPFASPLEALGWLYVIERQTLLHDEVRRFLSARIPGVSGACVYLSVTEGVASARWQDLGRRLDRAARTPRMLEEILAGARAGFRASIDWWQRPHMLQQHG